MSDYALAWFLYLLAALVAWGIAWRVIRRWPRPLSWGLLGLLAALLLMPMEHPLQPGWQVPAIMVLGLGTVSDGWESVGVPALSLLLIGGIPALLAGVGLGWWRRVGAAGSMLEQE